MKLTRYTNVSEFYNHVLDSLAQHEVENNLPIGILERGVRANVATDWFMARIEDDFGRDCLVALMTPPHNVILIAPDRNVNEASLKLLMEYALQHGIHIPGVIAEKELSCTFAKLYSSNTGISIGARTDERVYRLDQVENVPQMGKIRLADESDLHYLPYWLKGFHDECFQENTSIDITGAQRHIAQKTMYILEVEGRSVTMAGTTRQMPHGRSVGPVYTPPYLRGHGYATACVAMVSQIVLDRGNAYCVLFTDLANPTSNSIYQKIGYRPLCDYAEIKFSCEKPELDADH